MSTVLSVYSRSAYKEFVLPAINNAESSVTAERIPFRMKEDVELRLEVIDGIWSFLTSGQYTVFRGNGGDGESREDCLVLENGANYIIKTRNEESLSAIVTVKETSFLSYRKFNLPDMGEILIGSETAAAIRYTYEYGGLQYISKRHAVIKRGRGAAVLEDTSKNGVFINDRRVHGTQQLAFGDHIHIWGLDMVFLNGILAVRSDAGDCVSEQLREWEEKQNGGLCETHAVKKRIYHRAPRNMEMLETETIEIEPPPAPKEIEDVPLMMTIGPAMTMAIPMLMSSAMAIIGARSSGAHASAFMYTGILTSVSSAVIGAAWALNNIRYGKNRAKKEENRRFEAYGEYLIQRADEIKGKYNHNTQALKKMYPPAELCASRQMEESSMLWGRNLSHDDFLAHRLGIGEMPFQVHIQIPKERFTLINDSLADKPKFLQENYKILHQVPICVDLIQERIIGIVGGGAKAGARQVAYALIAQIASQNCYTDVKMAFAFQSGQEKHEEWGFTRWLPHVWSPDRKIRYVAEGKAEASDIFYELTKLLRYRKEDQSSLALRDKKYKPHFILFIEDQSLLTGELIENYIFDQEQKLGISVILMAESYEELPNICEYIIENTSEFQGIYNVKTGLRTEVEFDAISREGLDRMARNLFGIEVNESEMGGDIPNAITFFDMFGISRLEELNVADRWKKNRTYDSMKALVGQKSGGAPCYLDVHEKYHGPHGLVAGTTGSGKSETLQTYILSLAINFSPDDIGFFIIDYKGGGMANLFNGLPHLIGQISNLSGNQVRRAMVSIQSENKRRQQVFNEHGVNNINLYTTLYKNGEASQPIPHLFIIIDEFAELKREEGDFMKQLISVAQVGRSLGVHLILATQKPGGTVDDSIWSNSKFRLCLRVQDRQDSNEMLHRPDAAYLTQAGRCYLQVGNDELFELFQSGWSGAVYDENDLASQQVLARMLTNTGKTALVGNHVKRRRVEEQKEEWVGYLCGCCQEQAEAWEAQKKEKEALSMEDTREKFVVNAMFKKMSEDEVDYPESDYNRRMLENLLELWDRAVKEGIGEQRERSLYILRKASGEGKKLPEVKEKTQLDAVVKYLQETAQREQYRKPSQLWMPVLEKEIPLDALDGWKAAAFDGSGWPEYPEKWALTTMVGMYDDPMRQSQKPLFLNFTEYGHIAVCGMAMSGKSTFLQTVVYGLVQRYSPKYLNVYALDFSARKLAPFEHDAHVGGVLYESDLDSIGKFFYMLEKIMDERKRLFRGGNYSQYVMTYGVACPMILVVIDNIAGFREKTEFAYDDILMQMTRECTAYGIHFLISGAGFNSSEIPTRMRDNIHYTVCLEMTDRFQYSDCLGIMQLGVMPEAGVHGRGLAIVNGEALEFQTAVAEAEPDAQLDDYKRGEKIQKTCEALTRAWKGKRARTIPRLPEKAVWPEFEALEEVQSLLEDDRSLPMGYDAETAGIYALDLSRSYCFLISGKARTGKTNMLRVLAAAAKLKGSQVCFVEPGGAELKKFSQELGVDYVDSFEAYRDFMDRLLIPAFLERNRIKKECVGQGMEDEEIYDRMAIEMRYCIFIADLKAFVDMLYGEKGVRENMCGAMTNLFDKGFLHNIFFFACMNQDQRMEVAGKDAYEAFIRSKMGVHFGGNVAAQRIFEFGNMPFSEQAAVDKAGIGTIPPTESAPYCKIVVPLLKRQVVQQEENV